MYANCKQPTAIRIWSVTFFKTLNKEENWEKNVLISQKENNSRHIWKETANLRVTPYILSYIVSSSHLTDSQSCLN